MQGSDDTRTKLEQDQCMRDTPMAFCKVCGTWMHCKPDHAIEYERRPEAISESEPSD